MQAYSNPKRESDPHALPDLEIFYRTREENESDGWTFDDGEVLPAGWFWWPCFPGCMPESEPTGPFDSQEEALADARQFAGDDGQTDDDSASVGGAS